MFWELALAFNLAALQLGLLDWRLWIQWGWRRRLLYFDLQLDPAFRCLLYLATCVRHIFLVLLPSFVDILTILITETVFRRIKIVADPVNLVQSKVMRLPERLCLVDQLLLRRPNFGVFVRVRIFVA